MFVLPKLTNEYDAYEPYIDAQTMEIHHGKHHAGYVQKLNQAMLDGGLQQNRIEDFFEDITAYTPAIRNNAGGHYNHTVFWSILDIPSGSTPDDELTQSIIKHFGSLEALKNEVIEKALTVFGSGWCWLVVDTSGTLKVVTTRNQDNPLMSDIYEGYPLLGIDVWEHAYYLKYQNRRSEYLASLWSLLNWQEISRRYQQKPEMLELFS